MLLLIQWLLNIYGPLEDLINEIKYRALILILVQPVVRNEACDCYGTEKIHIYKGLAF